MKILVINAGSSSLKYQLIDMDNEQMLAKGNCERIGIDGVIGGSTHDGKKFRFQVDMPTHTDAFKQVEKSAYRRRMCRDRKHERDRSRRTPYSTGRFTVQRFMPCHRQRY